MVVLLFAKIDDSELFGLKEYKLASLEHLTDRKMLGLRDELARDVLIS